MGSEKLIQNELDKIRKYSRMLKGNIYEVHRKTKDSSGNLAVVYQLTYKGENNVTKTVYVKKSQIKEVRQNIINYKKAKAALERIIELNVQILKST